MLKIGNAAIKKNSANVFPKENSCLLPTPSRWLILRKLPYLKNVDQRSEPVGVGSRLKRGVSRVGIWGTCLSSPSFVPFMSVGYTELF